MNPEATMSSTLDTESAETTEFFIVAPTKVGVMSVLTFGLYDIYWMYQQWQAVAQSQEKKIQPFWRALFNIFFIGSLFQQMKIAQPILLAATYIILTLLWKLPDPWWLISFLSCVPLMMAQSRLNARIGATNVSTTYSTKAKVVVAAGAICLALAVYGTLAPQS